MNRISLDKQAQIVSALAEGNSINATCRLLGIGKHTMLRLLQNLGCACASSHYEHVRNVHVRRVHGTITHWGGSHNAAMLRLLADLRNLSTVRRCVPLGNSGAVL